MASLRQTWLFKYDECEYVLQVHTTFQYGGAQGKRHRLRESMIWEDSSEYYSVKSIAISFETCEPHTGVPHHSPRLAKSPG